MRLFARTLLTVIFAASFFAAASLAQRANSGAGYSAPMGHYSAPAGHFPSPAAHGNRPIGGGRNFPVRSFGPAPLGLRPPAAGYTGIDPGALRSRGFYRHRDYRHAPYAFVTPFYYPDYYPMLDYNDSGYDTSSPAGIDPAMESALANQNMLGEQIQRLTDEVDQLREQQQTNAQPPASESGEPAPAEPQAPPLTLVLRNGQQLQVQSYAVVDQTFWDFTNPAVRKIPLSSIDLAASAKATEANGGEFPQLTGGQ